MRKTFVKTLLDLAAQDPRVMLLTGDLGFMVLEPFQEKFPKQFFNVGVAEQNMVGIATGLAKDGFIPFIYSIATFAVLRPYEFIRNGPVAHNLKVRIVGVGGGFEYGPAGFTHHPLEDIGVLRLQPQMKVFVPADNAQAERAIRAGWDMPGPIYFRLSKNDVSIPELKGEFKMDSVDLVRSGRDALIISCGPITTEAISAANELASKGVDCAVAVLSVLNPAPKDALLKLLKDFKLVLTLENHYETGGLGSLVSEIVAEAGLGCRVIRQGVKPVLSTATGGEKYHNDRHGLSRAGIVEQLLKAKVPA